MQDKLSGNEGGTSPIRWLLLSVVFVSAVFVAKVVLGFAWVLLKWAIVGAVAVGLTVFVAKQLKNRD